MSEQEWLVRRLDGLVPTDLDSNLRIFAPRHLSAPAAFENVWLPLWDLATLLEDPQKLCTANLFMVLADLSKPEFYYLVADFIDHVDKLGCDGPPILWVSHSAGEGLDTGEAAIQLISIGLDGVLSHEPQGFDLALSVRSFVHKSMALAEKVNRIAHQRRCESSWVDYLKESTQGIIWDYLRARITPTVPAIDADLPLGVPAEIDGYQFGELLGTGGFASVYKLSSVTGEQQAMKVVDKSVIRDVPDLKGVKRMIDVMRMISSEHFRHRNVVELYAVYHSRTHLFFRLEYAGPQNLHRRLIDRERSGAQCRPLSSAATWSILSQAVCAVWHLHTAPRVCHLDVKPENLILEEGQEIALKLADFDFLSAQARRRAPCGTFPFLGPEVILEAEWDGFAADVWSLGVVLFEVLCGSRVVERILALDLNGNVGRPEPHLIRRVRDEFAPRGRVAELLRSFCRPESREFLAVTEALLGGALDVAAATRWDAVAMRAGMQQLEGA